MRTLFGAVGAAVALVMATAGAGAQSSPETPAPGNTPKMAPDVYKNIKVLKDVPADQVIPSMQFIAASLGVDCDYCHDTKAFDKDDLEKKKADRKKSARKMITMTFAINKDSFDGKPKVTCNSCHRGANDPLATPPIPAPESKSEAEEAAPAGLPSADQLLDKWVQALGGADAIQRISSRVEKATVTTPQGRQAAAEVYAKAPDMRLAVMHFKNGDNVAVYNGHAGWSGLPGRPPRALGSVELDGARLEADLYFAAHVKQLFQEFKVGAPQKIGDREAYLVVADSPGQPPVLLYLDQQSGLLVRMVRYADTALGRFPTQTDYSDYRDCDGVKVAFHWTVETARPESRFAYQVDQIQQNVPVDDAKFEKPGAPMVAAEN